ncbi:MAG: MFS transporter [Gammaproteobacteria bacterium]|nr:MFS transporter [Gammaproteobacteria bacterium]
MAPKKEIIAWAMYDFANSGYATVVLTAIFNSYFVGVIAGQHSNGTATLLWTLAIACANLLVLLSAPIIGAIADYSANKKRFLAFSTLGCVLFTALLSLCGEGNIALAIGLIIFATFMFASGENLVAAFLPEISPADHMGRISAFGWTLGYVGGLLVLGVCLYYVNLAQARGDSAEQFVPVTMLIVAAAFALAASPTLLWLKERATAQQKLRARDYVATGYQRLRHTLTHARQHQDLFRFLIALTVFTAGINTVIVLAAIYAQEVMGFQTQDTILLILVVNITAAIGAFIFGRVQDRIGSKRTLILTLLIWIAAMLLAYFSSERLTFWIVANLIGLALGASQSAGRALVGMFSPAARSGEYFGLWGLATKLAAIIGPLSYGVLTYLSDGDHRLALLCTTLFFIGGLLLLTRVDEQRGRDAAQIS